MSSRRVKQLIYGIAFALFWILVIWAIYAIFFKPAPSCFDGIQNEGETGIDCGGPCAKLCLPSDIAPLTAIGSVSVFPPLPNHVALLAQVENQNADFAADTFDYTFTLYDTSGNVLATVPGTSFIYADQTKYLAVPNQAVMGAVDHATLTIAAPDWVPAADLGLTPQFVFQDLVASSPASGTVTMAGTIIDQDPSSFSNLMVVAVFKNAAGAPVGVSVTQLDSITPNEPAPFSITYPIAIQNVNPAATVLAAYGMRN